MFLRESIAANSREGKFQFRLRQYKVRQCLMDLPVLGKAVALAGLAAVAVVIRAVVPLHVHRVHPLTYRRGGQRRRDGKHRPEDDAGFDLDHAVVLARLVNHRILQALRGLLVRLGVPADLAPAPGSDRLAVGLQDGRLVARVLIRGHQIHQPAAGPFFEIVYQELGVPLGTFARDHTDNQAMFGVEGHMVPVVAAQVICRLVRVAALLLLGDEGPLLVELDFTGLGGKKPRDRRGVARRGRRP